MARCLNTLSFVVKGPRGTAVWPPPGAKVSSIPTPRYPSRGRCRDARHVAGCCDASSRNFPQGKFAQRGRFLSLSKSPKTPTATGFDAVPEAANVPFVSKENEKYRRYWCAPNGQTRISVSAPFPSPMPARFPGKRMRPEMKARRDAASRKIMHEQKVRWREALVLADEEIKCGARTNSRHAMQAKSASQWKMRQTWGFNPAPDRGAEGGDAQVRRNTAA